MNNQVQFHVTTNLTKEDLEARLDNLDSYLDPRYVKGPKLGVDKQTKKRYVLFLFGPANVAMRAELAKTGNRTSDRRFLVVIKPSKGHERINLQRYSMNEFGDRPTVVFHSILDKVLKAEATKYGEVAKPVIEEVHEGELATAGDEEEDVTGHA